MGTANGPEYHVKARRDLEEAFTRAAELDLIRSVADDVIARVMKEGEAAHAVGEWRGLSYREHWSHVNSHLNAVAVNGCAGELPKDREDIEHAIVRLLFIVAKQKEGK